MSEVMQSGLRIGMLFDGYLRPSEGVPAYITDVGAYMDSRGHETSYLVGGHEGDLPNVVNLGRTATFGVNGNRVELALPISARRVDEVLHATKPDVLHLQMPHNPLVSGRVVSRADVPTVATFHVLPNSPMVSLAMRAVGAATRRSNALFSEVISNSRATQTFLRDAYRLDSTLIPNPVDVAKFQVGKRLERYDDGKVNLVFLGRLVERKGAQHLIEAVGALDSNSRKNVRVIIAGSGELQQKLRARTVQLGIAHQTRFLGYIEEADKPDLLASADLAAFPATGGESFGIVLAEAMAAGAGVVIGGNNAGYSSVLEDTPEALVNPTDTGAFSQLLHQFIHDTEERKRIHKIQQTAVKAFDISVVGAEIEKVYRRSLAK